MHEEFEIGNYIHWKITNGITNRIYKIVEKNDGSFLGICDILNRFVYINVPSSLFEPLSPIINEIIKYHDERI